MKHLPLILALLIGFAIGKIHSPAAAYEVPAELIQASREAINAAYRIGYEEGQENDDIGLVRLTVKDVEELI